MLGLPRRKKTKTFSPWYGFLILAVIAVAFGLKIVDAVRPDKIPTSNVPAVSYEDIKGDPEPGPVLDPEPTPTPDPEPVTPEPEALPTELNLAVPFTSQAPTGNWDELHEDACEEASFFMAVEFYAGRAAGKVDPAIVDPELYKMVELQTSLGMGYSISVAEAVEFIDEYYGLKTIVVDNPSVEDIKRLIAEGKPVIVPAAGRELGNPNFTGEGPLYHMYVIRGYTANTFITNDPGTRNGENYIYDIDVVMASMRDWNNGDPTTGTHRIFYIEPK